jgi:hypothetical protein
LEEKIIFANIIFKERDIKSNAMASNVDGNFSAFQLNFSSPQIVFEI